LMVFILTILLAFISGLYLPWWGIAIAAFIPAVIVYQKAGAAFLAGFLGLFLLWSVIAYTIDNANESIFSAKVGELLGVGNNPILLILITGFIGGLVGGFAAMTGSFVRRLRI
jgi:hypothetical protein